MTNPQVQELAEKMAAQYFETSDYVCDGWNTPMMEELAGYFTKMLELGRTQGLEEAAKYCELQSHECWKNVAHEEFMNRIDNAMQYDILVGEFKHLAIRIRKLAAIRPVE